MFGIIISVIVLLTMGYLILKNYKPQVVLAAAGIFLMICGVWLGYGALVANDKSSGYLLVDILQRNFAYALQPRGRTGVINHGGGRLCPLYGQNGSQQSDG